MFDEGVTGVREERGGEVQRDLEGLRAESVTGH